MRNPAGSAATRDERGSLPIAVLLTMVGLLLSTFLLNTVLQQNATTRTEIARVGALNAAQTGLDVGMAHLRAANDGSGNGVLASLPCDPFTGAPATNSRSSYAVTIRYYPTDPQNRSADWLLTNKVRCISGGGVLSTPAYALLSSLGTYTGAGKSASRTLSATYTFRTTDLNIPGGLIHETRTSTSATDLCWDAGSGSPVAGTAVQLQPCTSGSVRQTWSYNTKLTVSLVSSKTSTQPLGMCLDAGTPHAVGKPVLLQPCATPNVLPQQQWSYNDSSNWEGTANGSTLDGYCIMAQTASTTGSPLVLGSTSAGGCRSSATAVVFYPEPTVGAGAAEARTGQLVNFKQFARCLDVTNQTVSASYLISWQCKQAPNSLVAWNQKWSLPTLSATTTKVTQLVTTNPGSGLYCLRSPRSVAGGQYVKVVSCASTAANAELLWTFYGDTGTYATSYTVVDTDGHCLSPTDPSAPNPDLFSSGQNVSKIVVAVCDGSSLQKWNAPASLLQVLPLKDISEQ